jgi:ABC-type uncharacterized transport system permease subunit
MIERLEQQILHEKALCRPDVYAARVCVRADHEIANLENPNLKIDYSIQSSESSEVKTVNGALTWLKQRLTLIQLGNKGMCRKWAAVSSPATPDPSPSVSLRD